MNITNRLFTYPVLSDEKDDYVESIFSVDYEQTMQGVNSLKLTFDIAMNCQELEKLINNGQAEYVIHLECSTTAYREVLRSVSKHIEHVIPIGRINGSFDAVAFVILKKNVANFSCADWVDDYSEMTFNLFAGSILAYQNLPSLDITKDYEEFTNAGSIFSIYKRITEDDRPAEINLDSSKIRIGLGSRDYDVYAMYSTKTELQALFHSMLILPALVYVFEELRQEGGEETYHNKEWFLSLEKSYSKRGVVFMEEVLNAEKTSYQLAQEAMELPLSKALHQIPAFYETTEEDS
ncbi:MAG: hypothetical protein HDR01_06275 [Lachnospiraceae bacterium]|nr:hypothetical protein [Lachnospiraceae bacterium]